MYRKFPKTSPRPPTAGFARTESPPSISKKGGLSRVPKFPQPVGWEFLLHNYCLSGNKEALDALVTMLDAMAKGGIYNQLDGGFARYSTDAGWFAPHFETMLHDNGQLTPDVTQHLRPFARKGVCINCKSLFLESRRKVCVISGLVYQRLRSAQKKVSSNLSFRPTKAPFASSDWDLSKLPDNLLCN